MTAFDAKMPPHNLEAEQMVLCAILIDPSCFPKTAMIIKSADFYDNKTRHVFAACENLYPDTPIDQITIAVELEQKGHIKEIGGAAYLSGLFGMMPTSVHVEHYAKIIAECSARRQIISIAAQISAGAFGSEETTQDIISDAVKRLTLIRQGDRSDARLKSMEEIATICYEDPESWLGKAGKIRGICTGFNDLDMIIDGLERGKLYLLAARPGMGKTMLLLTIARNIAESGHNVAFFSLEQNNKALLQRLVFADARLDRYDLRRDGAGIEELARFNEAYDKVARLSLWIDDTAALSTQDTSMRLTALKADQDIDVMIYDYVDLAGDKMGKMAQNEEQRIASVVRGLKAIAKTLDIPVIAACQLNRQVENRTNRRPILSDLRSSGMLEAVGDVIMFLYRHEYYVRQGVADHDPDKMQMLEVLIAKNKDGPSGNCNLYYDDSTGLIANRAPATLAGVPDHRP